MAPDRNTTGRLLRILSGFGLAAGMFIASSDDCLAAPSDRQVTVELFSARRALSEVTIKGRVSAPGISPSAGEFLARMENRQLTLYKLNGGAVQARGPTRTQQSQEVALNISPAKRLGSVSRITCEAGSGIVTVDPNAGESDKSSLSVGRSYRGTITIRPASPTDLSIQNTVNLQDYVNSVVGSESLPNTPPEALKAQSVLVQTLMARKHERDLIKDTTEIQSYMGASYERPEAVDSVSKTWGRKLLWKNQPIKVYYHSCCAGATSSSRFFGTSRQLPAYDSSVKCGYCKQSNFYKETVPHVAYSSFKKAFPQGFPTITAKDESARPLSLSFPNHKHMTGYDFWMTAGQRFGWDKIPGTRFSIAQVDGNVEFRSTGGGHGVGLCQWGAAGLAKKGKRYDEILRFYFPGADLSK